MEKKTEQSPSFLRKRQFLLLLPLLVLPFVTLLFWAGGGGKSATTAKEPLPVGLNAVLPDAQMEKEEAINKLQLYEQAEKRAKERGLTFEAGTYPSDTPGKERASLTFPYAYDPSPLEEERESGRVEAKVYQKLEQLNRQLQSAEVEKNRAPARASYAGVPSYGPKLGSDEPQLGIKKEEKDKDPELEQLNAMMEKILDIQHPERLKGKFSKEEGSERSQPLTVMAGKHGAAVSFLGYQEAHQQGDHDFFGMSVFENEGNGLGFIQAAVHQTQTIISGTTIKLRLLADIEVNGVFILAGSFLFAQAKLEGERVQLHVHQIHHGNRLLPVELHAYDLDGIQGIFVPGTPSKHTMEQAVGRSIQSVDLSSVDPSLKGKAATVGMQTLRDLVRKVEKNAKVTLRAGYRVLLKNKSA